MDNIGFSQDDFDRDDAADALREMLVSGEYAEMFQSLKNDPELAKEMEKSLSASGMSWDDLKDSLDQMAKTGGPPPQGSAGRAGSSAGMQGSGSAKPSAGTSKGTVPKPTSSRPPGSIVVAPIPALVVKSVNNIATKKYAAGVKVFINLCHSPEMFAPPPLGSMPIEEVLKKPEDFDYRVPIAVGIPRAGLDKAGKSCVEIDACLHSSVIEMAEKDLEYQTFLVELVAEMVEEQLGLALSRDFSFPKMKVKGVVGKIVVQPPSSQQASPAVTNGKPAMSTAKIVELPDEPVQTPKQPPASSSQTPKPILKKTTASTPEPPKPVQEAVVERQTPPARTPPAAGPSQKKAAIGETVIERAPPAVAEVVRERGAPVPSKPLISEIVKEWNAPLTETVKERSSPMSETVKERSIPANGVAAEKRRAEPSVSPPSALPKIAPKTEELVPDLTEPKHTLQVSGVSPSRIIEIKIELPGMTTLASAALDLFPDSIALDVPAKFRLKCKLPFRVNHADESRGKAVFERSKGVLHVTLVEA